MADGLVPAACVASLERALAEHGIPGASLTVARAGGYETVVRGSATLRAPWPVTPATVFQLGSVAKVHTAVLLLQLVEQGRLDLDAPAAGHLPEWDGEARDRRLATITPRQLLSHTCGLQSQHFEPYGRGEGALSRLVGALRADELVHPPGELFSYSNTGYAVAGRLVEHVTGVTWHEAVLRFVAGALGLERTATLPEDVLLHPAAVGSRRDGDGPARVVERWYGSHALTPSGGVSCTGADLTALALEATAPGGSKALGLGESLVQEMLSPQVEVRTPGTRGWGLGWTVFETRDGSHLVGHNGDTPGQAAALRVLPERGLAVALLLNGQVGAAVTEPVVHEVLEAVEGVQAVPRDREDAPAAGGAARVAGGAAGDSGLWPGVAVEPLLGTYGQDRFEVEVSMHGSGLRLSTHRWGSAVLDWFGEPEMRAEHAAEVTGPGVIEAGGKPWWFLGPAGAAAPAYLTNGHLAFPRRTPRG